MSWRQIMGSTQIDYHEKVDAPAQRNLQNKNQKGAVDNKSRHTNEPRNIEPAGRPKK